MGCISYRRWRLELTATTTTRGRFPIALNNITDATIWNAPYNAPLIFY